MMAACRSDQCPIDHSVEIRVWMARRRIRPIEIARELGVSPSALTHFIDGKLVSQRIRDHFVKRGCPVEILHPENPDAGISD